MPFEIPPQFVPAAPAVEVGPFQKFAEAMLLGAAKTYPIQGLYVDGHGGACALGAVFVGMGRIDKFGRDPMLALDGLNLSPLMCAYHSKYGNTIESDNDHKRFTREQIADRIAALR